MLNYIKIELRRAFIGKQMLIALILSCAITLLQILVDVVPVIKYLDDTMYPHTVFSKCLSLIYSMFPVYYILIIALIAAMPCAVNMYKDRKTGYIKNIFTRTSKKNYYIGQYAVAFISGGAVAVIPQIINILIVALILPSVQPYVGIGYCGISIGRMWEKIFYRNAYLYLAMYMVLDFVFFGLMNTLALSFSWLVKNTLSVILFPFITFQFLDLATSFVSYGWMSESFLRASQQMKTNPMEIVVLILIMIVITIVSIIYAIYRKDAFE